MGGRNGILFAMITLVMIVGQNLAEGRRLGRESECPCNEIYVVEEGETLQTISNRCHAPYILEDNPQIKDTDDLFPGLVLMMQCDEGVVF